MTRQKSTIPDELLDQLLAGMERPKDLLGSEGLLRQLTARLVERSLETELSEHLGHDPPWGLLPSRRSNGYEADSSKHHPQVDSRSIAKLLGWAAGGEGGERGQKRGGSERQGPLQPSHLPLPLASAPSTQALLSSSSDKAGRRRTRSGETWRVSSPSTVA